MKKHYLVCLFVMSSTIAFHSEPLYDKAPMHSTENEKTLLGMSVGDVDGSETGRKLVGLTDALLPSLLR